MGSEAGPDLSDAMRALVYTAPLTIEVRTEPEPVPDGDDIVVDVVAAGICGSELEGFAAQSPMRVPPLVMGHEFAGIRADDGRRVVVNPLVSCGHCDLCRRGRANLCRSRSIIGIHRPGGFGERVKVPAGRCVDAPEGMTASQAAFVEPMANAAHVLRVAATVDPAPLRVGLLGAGALGFAVTAAAVARGVPHVAVADTCADRLPWVEAVGASVVGSALCGEFDVVVDAVGAPTTRAASVDLVRPGGAAVWLGLHSPEPAFDGQALIRSEKAVLGTFAYEDTDFAAAIHLASRLQTPWIEAVSMEESAAAFTRLLDGPTAALKTVIRPEGAAARWP